MSVNREQMLAEATDLAYADLMGRFALGRRRLALGLTQADVAARMDLTSEDIVDIESHDGDPRQSDIRRYKLFLWAEENGGWEDDGV